MMSEDEFDPLRYLNRIERLVVGPAVSRICAPDNPRIEKWVLNIGPRATARTVCGQALAVYPVCFLVFGLIFSSISGILLPLAMISSVWSFVVVLRASRLQKEFRRTEARQNDITL
jgi:hypothetical protein